MTVRHVKIEPGSDMHLTLLGVPQHFNLLCGQDRADMLAYARTVWWAAREQTLTEVEALLPSGGDFEVESMRKLRPLAGTVPTTPEGGRGGGVKV